MFINFFLDLKKFGIPVSVQEFLTFLKCLQTNLTEFEIEKFYFLAKTSLVKHEKYFDTFDQIFSTNFNGLEKISIEAVLNKMELPAEWLEKLAEKLLTAEQMKEIKSLGSFEKLMETLKKRLEEQKGRHQGGNKWIGTAGTSPFGAYGYNPEGVRIGQNESRHQKAVKVWDKRNFKNLNENNEISSRSMKIALKRLRLWARNGLDEELDLDNTISSTARSGFLDIKTRPEKENAVKLLIFFDIGGSMDMYVAKIQELFSAARSTFKHVEYYYFHNCLYEGVWRNNNRRWEEQICTYDLLHKYNKDYKCIFVGDAAMSPYEIEMIGGANEHYNNESGRTWLQRARNQWPNNIWINPTQEDYWQYTQSTKILQDIFESRMVPLTLNGLDEGMKLLN
ncbi:MAG: vWA domain-containing protein [Paracoccaceae bacterium]